jgi:hypothetical protein
MRTTFLLKTYIILIVLLLAGFAYSILNPWSRINCVYEDIDIKTGRVHIQRNVLFIRVSSQIKETSISKIWGEYCGEYPAPVWRRVNTFWGFDVGGSSPHHAYHGAVEAARVLEMSFALTSFSREAQKKAIQTFFQLMQVENSDKSASRYAQFVAMQSAQKDKQGIIKEDDIPSLKEWVDTVKKGKEMSANINLQNKGANQ